jgi:hypothetical protein
MDSGFRKDIVLESRYQNTAAAASQGPQSGASCSPYPRCFGVGNLGPVSGGTGLEFARAIALSANARDRVKDIALSVAPSAGVSTSRSTSYTSEISRARRSKSSPCMGIFPIPGTQPFASLVGCAAGLRAGPHQRRPGTAFNNHSEVSFLRN